MRNRLKIVRGYGIQRKSLETFYFACADQFLCQFINNKIIELTLDGTINFLQTEFNLST